MMMAWFLLIDESALTTKSNYFLLIYGTWVIIKMKKTEEDFVRLCWWSLNGEAFVSCRSICWRGSEISDRWRPGKVFRYIRSHCLPFDCSPTDRHNPWIWRKRNLQPTTFKKGLPRLGHHHFITPPFNPICPYLTCFYPCHYLCHPNILCPFCLAFTKPCQTLTFPT